MGDCRAAPRPNGTGIRGRMARRPRDSTTQLGTHSIRLTSRWAVVLAIVGDPKHKRPTSPSGDLALTFPVACLLHLTKLDCWFRLALRQLPIPHHQQGRVDIIRGPKLGIFASWSGQVYQTFHGVSLSLCLRCISWRAYNPIQMSLSIPFETGTIGQRPPEAPLIASDHLRHQPVILDAARLSQSLDPRKCMEGDFHLKVTPHRLRHK